MGILEQVKIALRITTTAYDAELVDLIAAAISDLGSPGVHVDKDDSLTRTAITTYVKIHFGEGRLDLLDSYNLQKAQLAMSSTYNGSGDSDEI